jgi:hypothetical protein
LDKQANYNPFREIGMFLCFGILDDKLPCYNFIKRYIISLPLLNKYKYLHTQRKVFRIENYLLLHDEFLQVMQHGWNVTVSQLNKTKETGAKFKNLRRVSKVWHAQLSNINATIRVIRL